MPGSVKLQIAKKKKEELIYPMSERRDGFFLFVYLFLKHAAIRTDIKFD